MPLEVVHDRPGVGVPDGHDHADLLVGDDPQGERGVEAKVADEHVGGAREQGLKPIHHPPPCIRGTG